MTKYDFIEKEHICPVCNKKVIGPNFIMKTDEDIIGMCIIKNKSGMEHIKIERKKLYNSIPKEKKVAFLNYFRIGKTVGESYKAAGLTQEEGFAVLDINLEKTYYLRKDPI